MFSQSNFINTPLDLLLLSQWLSNGDANTSLLPKPIPVYSTSDASSSFNICQQSVIKSTKSLAPLDQSSLPKCLSPKIACESPDEKSSTKQLIKSTNSKTTSKGTSKNSRLSYAREYKLMVISYFMASGQNKYRTCKKFHITKSMLNGWISKADKIMNSRPGTLKTGHSGRKPQFPNIEERLYEMYVERKAQGYPVNSRNKRR